MSINIGIGSFLVIFLLNLLLNKAANVIIFKGYFRSLLIVNLLLYIIVINNIVP